MNGFCDVPGCTNETCMGWRPLTKRMGKQICLDHWQRHNDIDDDFDLFDAFGFERPAHRRLMAPVHREAIPSAEARLGKMLAAIDRSPARRSSRAGTSSTVLPPGIDKKQSHTAQQEPAQVFETGCKACGGEREPGHTYCKDCRRERQRQKHRERQKRYRQRKSQVVKA